MPLVDLPFHKGQGINGHPLLPIVIVNSGSEIRIFNFLPNLQVVLLGVNNFLSRFILTMDYPKKQFSQIDPQEP